MWKQSKRKTLFSTMMLSLTMLGAIAGAQDRNHRESKAMARITTVYTDNVGDRDWDTPGNWSNGVPVNGVNEYTVVFDPRETHLPPILNLDNSADEVSQITFLPGWDFGMGTLANPLKIQVDSDSAPEGTDLWRGITINGAGYYYIEPQNATDFSIESAGTGFTYISGNYRHLFIESGNCQVASGTTATGSIWVFGGYLDLLEASDQNIKVLGGVVDINDTMVSGSAVNVSGGVVNVFQGIRTSFTIYGGRVNMLQSGTIFVSGWHVLGGVLDFSKSSHEPDVSSDFIIGPGARVIWGNQPSSIGTAGVIAIDLNQTNP